ncbi:MAG: hypothetical protein QM803_07865 [Rhodocyclaceae bacterium]
MRIGWLFGLGLDCLIALAGSSPRRASSFLVLDKKVTKEAAPQRRRPLADPLRCAVEKAAAELALRAQTVLADGYRRNLLALCCSATLNGVPTPRNMVVRAKVKSPCFQIFVHRSVALANHTSLLIEQHRQFTNGG